VADACGQRERGAARTTRGLDAVAAAAETAERTRLAEALHDDTIQAMTAALLSVQRAEREHPSAQLREAIDCISGAIERARTMVFALSPITLTEHGLRGALEVLCTQVAAQAGFTVSLDLPGRRFSESIEQVVYRTVREALINARRHSRAQAVVVRITDEAGWLQGEVGDDGVGFDPEAAMPRAGTSLHLGLRATERRLQALGGCLDVQSRPGHGTRVTFSVPHDDQGVV
jgi:signal transduction histidine kinase